MTGATAATLADHLLRDDGQEDVCLATYRVSTGTRRTTTLINRVLLPALGEREVHGNASFTGDYVVRVAADAAANGEGVIILHSHPGGSGWQRMSPNDKDAERSYAYLVNEMTGLPLVGMTLGGRTRSWSARTWTPEQQVRWCESVRVIDDRLSVSWNDELRPPPPIERTQLRTASGWGNKIQKDIARLRVLVVGAGSVGLEVALRLAATGIQCVGVMDYDTVEHVNLDRLIGATSLDALLHRSKAHVAGRLVEAAATAANATIERHDMSICTREGQDEALNYDVIFSCVDRPWPRAVLNTIAYADLIPVIDGGIHIDPFPDEGMRNATWRSHVIRPGRPCLACNRQLDLGAVPVDREGLLEDPTYIAGLDPSKRPVQQNVAALSVSVVSGLLAQFVSFVAAPGGQGEPGPLRYILSTHTLEQVDCTTGENCYFENSVAVGDRRVEITGEDLRATRLQRERATASNRPAVRLGHLLDGITTSMSRRITGLLYRERSD